MEKIDSSKIVIGLLIGIITILSIICIMLYINNKKDKTDFNLDNNQNILTNNSNKNIDQINSQDNYEFLIVSTNNQNKSIIVSSYGNSIEIYCNDSTTFYKRELMTDEEYNNAIRDYNLKIEDLEKSKLNEAETIEIPEPPIQDKLVELDRIEDLDLTKDNRVEIHSVFQENKNIALSIIKL